MPPDDFSAFTTWFLYGETSLEDVTLTHSINTLLRGRWLHRVAVLDTCEPDRHECHARLLKNPPTPPTKRG